MITEDNFLGLVKRSMSNVTYTKPFAINWFYNSSTIPTTMTMTMAMTVTIIVLL